MNDEQGQNAKLTPDDERLLDALVDCGFEVDALSLSDEERRRAEALVSLLTLTDDYPVEDADDALVDATLAGIDRHERERVARMKVDEAGTAAGRLRRIRVPDFISVAAVILIGAAITLPILNNIRQKSIDTSCANNLRWMSYAFSNYAADYKGELPMAKAGWSSWATGFENTVVNLAPLIEGEYCNHGHRNCPGHEGQAGPSYSYQWQSNGARPRWGTGRVTLILGDRNPLIDAFRSGGPIEPSALSSNHAGRGQNVLSTDGEIRWLDRSTVDHDDNIWMPREGLRDGASTDARDIFLAH